MNSSIQSQTIPTESSSAKSYYVKKKGIKHQLSKQAKQFFKPSQFKEHQILTPTNNLSSSRKFLTIEDSIISSKNDININRFMTISPTNPTKSSSDLIFIAENQDKQTPINAKNSFMERLKSVSSFMDSVGKKRVQKKYVFETVCDQSFNKSLVKRQIIIEDPDISNPEAFNFLPQITKSNTSANKSNTIQSRFQRSTLSRNSSKFTQNSPFHLIQSQFANKFSIQRLKDYHNVWMMKERKRKDINETSKITRLKQNGHRAAFHVSLLQKSVSKSRIIVQHNNKNVQLRKSKSYWEEELRGNKKKYVTIGQPSPITGLKGNAEKSPINAETKPVYATPMKSFACEEVYKSHNSESKPN